MMKRSFVRRRANRPSLSWSDVSGQFVFAAAAVTTATIVVQLQSPTALNALTSDPPEDLTLLRLVGAFTLALTGTVGNWTLALTVADVTWTPGATFATDADKRILWHRTYVLPTTTAVASIWGPPGWQQTDGGQAFPSTPELVSIDIQPKVRVEPGKALYLVAYENTGTATCTLTCTDMRLLYKRSGRR